MRFISFNFFICLAIISYFFSAFGENGHLYVINEHLQSGAANALDNFEQLFREPGPNRVHLRKMLESIIGEKRNGRATNPGIVPFGDGYMFSIRMLFHNSKYPLTIVPGNRAESKFEKGENFWWQDFASPDFSGGTLYFYADADIKNFSFLAPLNYSSYSEQIYGQDIRLVKINDSITTFNPKSTIIATEIDDIYLIPNLSLGGFQFKKTLWNKKMGNNYAAIDIDMTGNKYSYVDWFFSEGVRFAQVADKKVSYNFLPYSSNQYPILGSGSTVQDGKNAQENSGIMPLFSLGSSHLKLDENTYLGVGHTKIHVDEELFLYKEDSAIDQFRKNLTKDFKQEFGERYIRHDAYNSSIGKNQGYHYLLYFYSFKLDSDGKPIEMKMSDSFLPIDIKSANKQDGFVFSLVFPMGVVEKQGDPNTILISTGIGDYYAAVIELPKQFAIDLCKHNITNLNMANYEYKIMRFDGDGHFDIVNQLKQ